MYWEKRFKSHKSNGNIVIFAQKLASEVLTLILKVREINIIFKTIGDVTVFIKNLIDG